MVMCCLKQTLSEDTNRIKILGVLVSIEATKKSFEESFKETTFYNKQTQDENHLRDILSFIEIAPEMRVLDLGCGSGYLTFPIAKENPNATILGLDIVTKTLEHNSVEAKKRSLYNLEFKSYDGKIFPFDDETFDLVITRYALHHFPDIELSMHEVARVLKPKGRLFISDPRPNECDITRFVDDYMQLKKDGHIKFYTKDEWFEICGKCGFSVIQSFDSQISFPRKKSTSVGFDEVIRKHDKMIVDSYEFYETEDEIWVTEKVNNILFCKD